MPCIDGVARRHPALRCSRSQFRSKLMHPLRLFALIGALASAALFLGGPQAARAQKTATPFDGLTEGKVMHGFRTTAIYLNDFDRPMGARFVHERTGFVLDLL